MSDWAATALSLVGALDDLDGAAVVDFVLSCQHECGGFGGNVDHDPHMLYTLSAVQILCLFDALPRLDADRVMRYVSGLQREDGAFAGDEWGEIDTRFSYCALCCASLLGRMSALDVTAAVAFVRSCENFDGGYGCLPGGESHAGQVFTCVGALAIAGSLEGCQRDLLAWWLCERQTPGGGLNGRPQKEADVCYSWWVLSSLCMLRHSEWIDGDALRNFILCCQDVTEGGISDKPGDEADVFHTCAHARAPTRRPHACTRAHARPRSHAPTRQALSFLAYALAPTVVCVLVAHRYFGIAGLALLERDGVLPIDPVHALPTHVMTRLREQRGTA